MVSPKLTGRISKKSKEHCHVPEARKRRRPWTWLIERPSWNLAKYFCRASRDNLADQQKRVSWLEQK